MEEYVNFPYVLLLPEELLHVLSKAIRVPDSRQEVRIMDIIAGDRVFCYDSKNNLTVATVTWSGKTGELSPVMTTSYLDKDDEYKTDIHIRTSCKKS